MALHTTSVTARLSPEQIAEARGWLRDIGLAGAAKARTDRMLESVERHYGGGLAQYARDTRVLA